MTPDARPMRLLCLLEGKGSGQHLPSLTFPYLGSGPGWANSRKSGFFLPGAKVKDAERPQGSWGVKEGCRLPKAGV